MKNKYIILSSTIVVLIIILVLTILINDKGILKTRIKKLNDTITTIEIKNAKNPIINIVNKDGEWRVNNNYNIDKRTIDDMLSAITNVEINTLVSKPSDEMLEKYNLKDNGIEVSAYDSNNKLVRKIVIGDRATLSYDAYGQIDNDKNIYLLTSNLNLYDIFSPPLDKIVSKTVIAIGTSSIHTINIKDLNNSNTYSLTKYILTNNPPVTNSNGIVIETEDFWTNQNNVGIENFDLVNIYDLTDIRAEMVYDTKIDNKTNKSLYTIAITTLSTDSKGKEYTIYDKNDKDMYRIVVRTEKLNYYITADKYSRLTNSIEFIKNPKNKRQ